TLRNELQVEPDAETERLFWESVKDSDNAETFQAYLAEYPNGAFATLARIRLKGLQSVPAPAEPKVPASAVVTKISAAGDWQDSGVRVRRGERYHIRATGTWSMGPLCGQTDASGSGVGFICDLDPWNIGVSGSSLVGRIGEDGAPFPVGDELELVANKDGTLYLTSYGLVRWDNTGSVTVRITALTP
ncbi:MAG: hypothetical protein ACE5F6_22005, partial [Anaerolineae bacterium]